MRYLFAALAVALVAGTALAQSGDSLRSSAPPPVTAVRITTPIVLDGRLDDAGWSGTTPIDGFQQEDPDQGAPVRQRTEVRIGFDDEALYVGARMFDSAPDSIVARLTRRDRSPKCDAFYVFLDPFHDKRTGYYFGLTAAGTQLDGVFLNDGMQDGSWDAVWHGHVRRDGQGWTAEMKVPFSQLRFRGDAGMVWGINFKRLLNRVPEQDLLVYTPRGHSGFISRFPELHGLEGLATRRTLEVTPYVTAKGEFLVHDPGDPFNDGSRLKAAVGGDLRTRLGPKFTLNATVNPDFGQVEIDPAVVNLTDVETYFEEKRPFFTEGLSVFRCGQNGASDYWNFNWSEPTFFYTRRIGRAPQGRVPGSAEYVDAPQGTHILGAVKITGQPAPGWNVGLVQALTARERAKLSTAGVESRSPVEPLTYYGVLRGMREFNDHRQGLGLMTTTVARSFDGASALESQLNRSSVTATTDGWTFLDSRRDWVVSGYLTGSVVTGTASRISSLQRNSTHYYQRPDASYLGVDPNATSLTGGGGRLWLNHQNGSWLVNSAVGALSPGFENNDLGFLAKADVINAHFGSGWQWNEPHGWRQNASLLGALVSSWDFGGNNTRKMLFLEGSLEQRNRNSWDVNAFLSPSRLNNRSTRGGPLVLELPSYNFETHFDTNSGAKRFYYLNVGPGRGDDGSWEISFSPGIVYKPVSNLSVEFNPTWERSLTDAFYVRDTLDVSATRTYGRRWLFAALEQSTLSASLRVDYSLTPNLSIQFYAQPYITTAHYRDFKGLDAPRSRDFVRYTASNPAPFVLPNRDFDYRSIRGNAIVRWEYRPGSTVFFVWTQNRESEIEGVGEFNARRALSSLSTTPANNVFLVKVAHHFEL